MTGGELSPGPGLRVHGPAPDPSGADAVRQAERWLAERGIAVPPDRDGTPAARQAALPALANGTAGRKAAQGAEGDAGRVSRGLGSHPAELAHPADPVDPADPDADAEAVARTIVLRRLAVQARTRSELHKALKAKQVPDEAARAVLDRMEAVGLIDDRSFARDWVESRQQRRHLSRTALRRELTTKGVDRDEIDAALEPVDGQAELQAARSLAAKKVRTMGALDQQVRYRRLAGMLGRRGFSPGVISRVVDEYVSSAPE